MSIHRRWRTECADRRQMNERFVKNCIEILSGKQTKNCSPIALNESESQRQTPTPMISWVAFTAANASTRLSPDTHSIINTNHSSQLENRQHQNSIRDGCDLKWHTPTTYYIINNILIAILKKNLLVHIVVVHRVYDCIIICKKNLKILVKNVNYC